MLLKGTHSLRSYTDNVFAKLEFLKRDNFAWRYTSFLGCLKCCKCSWYPERLTELKGAFWKSFPCRYYQPFLLSRLGLAWHLANVIKFYLVYGSCVYTPWPFKTSKVTLGDDKPKNRSRVAKVRGSNGTFKVNAHPYDPGKYKPIRTFHIGHIFWLSIKARG